jgi:hypothetical protein
MPKGLRASMGIVGTSTSQGRNFYIRSSFGVFYTSSERSNRGVHIPFIPDDAFLILLGAIVPKKCEFGASK